MCCNTIYELIRAIKPTPPSLAEEFLGSNWKNDPNKLVKDDVTIFSPGKIVNKKLTDTELDETQNAKAWFIPPYILIQNSLKLFGFL